MERVKDSLKRTLEWANDSGWLAAVLIVFAVVAFLTLIWSANTPKPVLPTPPTNSLTESDFREQSGLGFHIRVRTGPAEAKAAAKEEAPLPVAAPVVAENNKISFVLLLAGDRAVLYEAARGDVTFKDGVVTYTSTEGRVRRFLGGQALHSESPLPFNGNVLVRSATGRIFKAD